MGQGHHCTGHERSSERIPKSTMTKHAAEEAPNSHHPHNSVLV